MKVLSINVSLPKEILDHGKKVLTGIFKTPVTGPIAVRALNLEGDGQGDLSVHGGVNKAVYAYSSEHFDFWKTALGRENLKPGAFGENLTVEGILESDIAVGDELEIGTARFRVTQPRFPCFKIGIAFGDPEFPKAFLQSGRTGFYLRVVREGIIKAGDSIRLFNAETGKRITVADFVKVYRTRKAGDEELRQLLAHPMISDSWKDWFQAKVNREGT